MLLNHHSLVLCCYIIYWVSSVSFYVLLVFFFVSFLFFFSSINSGWTDWFPHSLFKRTTFGSIYRSHNECVMVEKPRIYLVEVLRSSSLLGGLFCFVVFLFQLPFFLINFFFKGTKGTNTMDGCLVRVNLLCYLNKHWVNYVHFSNREAFHRGLLLLLFLLSPFLYLLFS